VNLTVMQVLLGIIISCIAIYAGVSQGVERIGTSHIRNWWANEGCPSTKTLIDESIADHKRDTELELQEQLSEIKQEISELKTIAEQNQTMTNRLLDKLIAGQ
jgi:hypothetical protein